MTTRGAILVTGGAGYIGSHTCKQLAAAGYLPVAFDNLARGHRNAVRWGPLVEGDIRDAAALEGAIRQYRPSAICHIAALAYVGESVADPAAYYSNNVVGTLSVLEAARRTGIERLVFSSSCATYGAPDVLPVSEAAAQRPISPYGRSKLMGEQIIQDYGRAYASRSVILRYFNACGCDPAGEIGEWHSPETHLVPRVLMAAHGILPSIEIYGDDHATPDGTCVRDYIHVTDLARAHGLALEHLARGGESLALNLGTGQGLSVQQILEAAARQTGHPVPSTIKPRRRGDPPILYADPTLARRKLGFMTQHSDIETILGTARAELVSRQPVSVAEPR
ncbi:UDP-glucose 4-epimerase GalE [Kaistia defluvii]|uniref:UDP-glucose 4-epimerase GalE n=1 Tax=Kaistia defluvii TaxID=410841 RepID=UPI00225AF6B4|nr:UDP-glucose 4-epimerase GalE [Kaistia defluvii]MCX5517581.1 UDP-glucose 4-epimerase GalE [Kaistia defluvii]